jgi:hypothetical protein
MNEVVGERGWKTIRTIKTLSGIPRRLNGRVIQSAKVIAGCELTIHGLGTKSESAEQWADQDNASAKADAQALKRACAGFGLGQYLYEFGEIWVPVDMRGRPAMIPELPQWALPRKYRSGEQGPRLVGSRGKQITRPNLIDVKRTGKIESFRRLLGEPIYSEVLARAGQCQTARTILTAERQLTVEAVMERAAHFIRKVHSLARKLGNDQLLAEMKDLGLSSATEIPSLDVLMQLLESLEAVAQKRAA